MTKIALDAMGGDHGPSVVVPAALKALSKHPVLHVVLVGDQSVLSNALLQANAAPDPRLTIHHASQEVGMDEAPAVALRSKKDSSMRVAINLVKSGEVAACVSAGNTGALMAIARFVLKTLPGIDRPAIVSAIPTMRHPVYLLDLGANVECHADHLFQFAVMGSVLCNAIEKSTAPKVGLLNIGSEAIKGSEPVKRAAQILSQCEQVNYIGFVEGDDIFEGTADVIVCDGFVGNITLKASEGLAKMFADIFKKAFKANLLTKMVGIMAAPIVKKLVREYDPASFNGASLIGLNGIVIKSHGGAKVEAFANAIEVALLEVDNAVPERISDLVSAYLMDRETA